MSHSTNVAPIDPPAGQPDRFHSPRVRRYALLLGIAIWGVLALNMTPPGVIALNGHVKGEDYSHFYVLGRLALDKDAATLYDMAAQASYMQRAIPGVPLTYFVPVYGPQTALLFAPFAVLEYLPSLVLWSATTVLCYVACGLAVLRACPRLHGRRRDVVLYLIASPALWQLVVHGHTSVLALAAFTAGWWCLRSQRALAAGLAFGILFYKPQLGLAIGITLALTGYWRVLAGMAISAIAQLALGALWFGTAAVSAYVGMLSRLPALTELIEPKPYLLQSFRGFFAVFPPTSDHAAALSVLCSLAILAVVARHWRVSRDPDAGFAMLLIATVLVSPHTNVYDLVIVTPALMLIVDRVLEEARRSEAVRPDVVSLALVAATYALPLLSWAAAYLHVQLSVVCLTWLLLRTSRSIQISAPASTTVMGGIGKYGLRC
jgi:hypothetical protein